MDFRLPPENPLTLVMGSVKLVKANSHTIGEYPSKNSRNHRRDEDAQTQEAENADAGQPE